MPTQSDAPSTVFYVEGDTAPSLRAQLCDLNGDPIPLTSASSVTITIAPARWSYYFSPIAPIVDGASCVIDPDQVANPGYVDWYPDPGDLSPAGNYRYRFKVTWNDGTVQRFPQNETMTLVIRAETGGG